MSRSRVKLPPSDSELARLVELLCEGTIRPAERDRLESLLADDRDARLYCVAYLDLHARAIWHTRGRKSDRPDGAGLAVAARGDDDGRIANDEVRAGAPQSVAAPTHDSSFIIRQLDLLGGVVAGYAVAVLLLGSAVLATWAWQRCGDGAAGAVDQLVRGPDSPASAPSRNQPAAPHVFVTEINPQWVHPQAAPADVRRGVFELAGGMVEVTYEDTGRKVLLVGPATYFVDSSESGALLDGLALVYSLQRPDAKTILEHPLFRIRTPTVVVTDGGGSEFMVGVDKTPESHVSVLGGRAEVQLAGRSATKTLQTRDEIFVKLLPNHGLQVRIPPGNDNMKATITAQRLKRRQAIVGQMGKQATSIEIEKTSAGQFPDS